MKRAIIGSAFLFLMIVASVFGVMIASNNVSATGTSTSDFSVPSCPLVAGANKTIVTFPTKKLISTGSYEDGYVRAATNLPKGTYKITAVSFDGYTGRTQTAKQPSESYSIGFESGAQSTWQWAKGTSDLADFVEQDTKTTVVETGFVLKNDISMLRAQHVTFDKNGSPNSVYPVCASFERIDVPTTPTTPTTPSTEFYTPTCPLTPQAGRTIVEFKDGTAFVRLIAGQAGSPTSHSEFVSIESGDYTITGYSYDGYSDRASTNPNEQKSEQWYLDIYNGVGNTIATYGPTADLADGVKEASVTANFATNALIGEPIAKITARHATPNTKYNSVVPVCVAFDKKPVAGPTCPLTPSADTTIVNFGTTVLRSDLSQSSAIAGPVAVNLASGQYDVTLASYDDHTHKVGQVQPNERWFVELNNGVQSNAISDLPDSQDYLTQKVNTNLTIGNASSVKAVHAAYPDNSSPNSIIPICAAFKKLPDTPKPPTCTMSANPSTISAGGSATLSWSSTNTKSATIDGGVGSVSTTGTKVVSPSQTTTYTGTFVGTDNSVVTCSQTIVVVPLADPICQMTITPSTVVKGGLATLSWTTSNVTSATISDGVGQVAVNGSKSVSPSDTTTYIGTFVGNNGKTITCSAKVTVTPPPASPTCPIAPRDGLTVVPITTNIITANSSQASATVGPFALNLPQGSYRVYLASYDDHTNKPGQVQPNESWELALRSITGSTIVTTSAIADLPDTQDYLVELVNSNLKIDGDVKTGVVTHAAYPNSNPNSIVPICAAFEKLPEPKDPICTLTGFPTTITKGGEVLLSWTSQHALSASLDNNIGSIDVQGSKTVSPTETTTYRATFMGEAGKSVTCVTTIVVNPTPNPVCALSASPSSIQTGGTATLVWTSSNTSSGSIDNGVGSIAVNGSVAVSPTQTTTYTATFIGNEGKTVSCDTTITVSPKPEPVCTLTVNPGTITQGGVATLVWTTENASSVTINNGVGSVAVNGSQSVTPSQSTTYVASVTGVNGKVITCSAPIVVLPPPQTPTCPLVGGAGKILIDFGDGLIRSDQTKANSEKGPFSTEIPSGIYKVTLASFDEHSAKPGQVQPDEKWFLSFARFGGLISLGTSGTIGDLPDDQNYLSQVVNERLEVTQTITQVTAKHAAYPNSNPNSIIPICALFERVESLAPAKISGCVYVDANKNKVKDADDAPIPGTTISLTGTTVSGSSVTKTTTTGADGCYLFDNLEQGTYTVIESQPAGYEDWFDQIGTKGGNDSVNDVFSSIVLAPGDHSERNNFGELRIIPDPICAMNVDKSVIKLGESITLTWSGTNVTSVTIDNGVGSVGASGTKNLSPTTNVTYTGTFVGENGKTITCSAPVVVKQDTLPVCPLSPSQGITIVNLSTSKIRSDQSGSAAETSPVPAELAKGTYKVTLASFDYHTDRTIVTEPKEQWFVKLRDLVGSTIVSTNASPDLADTKDYDVSVVNSELVISQDTKTAVAVHAAYPDASTTNDIVPLCAAFEKLPEPQDPVCAMSVAPSTIKKGESATITWTSQNTFGATMDAGIGAIAVNGSKVVSPEVTTEYTGTFTGEKGKTVTCKVTVTVETPIDPPFCTLVASPQTLANAGDTATLTWTTLRATSISIDKGIGSVAANNSTQVSPTQTTTYTLTATGSTGAVVTCQATVTVPNKVPVCEMTITPNRVVEGQNTEVTLAWSGTNVTKTTITPDLGDVSVSGSAKFVANSSKLYTGVFSGEFGTTTCTARIDLQPLCPNGNCGGGGGLNPPRVTIASTTTPPSITPPTDQPLAFVYLSQVPYTGFEAGPLLTFFFWLTVLVVTGIMTHYLIVRQYLHRFIRVAFTRAGEYLDEREVEKMRYADSPRESVNEYSRAPLQETHSHHDHHAHARHVSHEEPRYTPAPSYAPRAEAPVTRTNNPPHNLPTGAMQFAAPQQAPVATPADRLWHKEAIADRYLEGVLEKAAYESDVLVSPEGLAQIIAYADSNEQKAHMLLEEMILAAKKLYPREDGWIPLNRERIQALRIATRDIDGERDKREVRRDTEIAQDVPASVTKEETVVEAPADTITDKAVEEFAPVSDRFSLERYSRDRNTQQAHTQSSSQGYAPRERFSAHVTPHTEPRNERAAVASHDGMSTISAIATFVSWLAEGKEEKSFNFLRKLAGQGYDAQNFLMQVVTELDDVFKNRIEGGRRANRDLLEVTSVWSNGELESIIEILSGGVDYTYSHSQTGAKIAIAKVVDFIEKQKGRAFRKGE